MSKVNINFADDNQVKVFYNEISGKLQEAALEYNSAIEWSATHEEMAPIIKEYRLLTKLKEAVDGIYGPTYF